MRYLTPIASVSALLWLTGCATSTEAIKPNLPPAPSPLVACAQAIVPALPGARGTGWTDEQVVGIIGDQRAAAASKDRCSRNWQAFYEDLRARLSGHITSTKGNR